MLRFVISEQGQPELPPVDIDAAAIVIGSDARAQIRLPATAAKPEHVRIDGASWFDGATRGTIGDGVVFDIGSYRVRVTPAPAGVAPSPPQRTESLARELMRGLLGTGAEPTLAIERGPKAGAQRTLPPPEAKIVIGRGDDADWSILDEDLSREHAEVRRTWDGTLVVDLDSQNGTRLDGKRITEPTPLRDGARIELGNVVMLFRDPADRQLTPPEPKSAIAAAPTPRTLLPFAIAAAIALIAIAGLVYILAS